MINFIKKTLSFLFRLFIAFISIPLLVLIVLGCFILKFIEMQYETPPPFFEKSSNKIFTFTEKYFAKIKDISDKIEGNY